jgi:hypothetical protein
MEILSINGITAAKFGKITVGAALIKLSLGKGNLRIKKALN